MRAGLPVALLFVAGCPTPPARPVPAMHTAADGTCAEVAWSCVGMQPDGDAPWGCTEGTAAQTSQYQATCTPAKGGRFALDACMRDDLIGGCTLARGTQCTTTWYYAPATAATIAADCRRDGGTVVAP